MKATLSSFVVLLASIFRTHLTCGCFSAFCVSIWLSEPLLGLTTVLIVESLARVECCWCLCGFLETGDWRRALLNPSQPVLRRKGRIQLKSVTWLLV